MLTGLSLKAKIAILTVLIGCCSNVVFFRAAGKAGSWCRLVTHACLSTSSNLVTFSQFVVIAIEGFAVTTKFGTVKPKVPFQAWATLVAMYFLVSVINNYTLNFDIPMPLHMIFRAGSLFANMVMGIVVMGRRYTLTKYLSVLMITVGIATCTISSASLSNPQKPSPGGGEPDPLGKYRLLVGISMLTVALLLSARMGVYQEVIYGKYGKYPKEALFYTHALPLPGFLLLSGDIWHHFNICLASSPITLPYLNVGLPSMVLYLIGNVMTQYLCILSVFILTSECPSLLVTLVVTLRKFLSLLFSIWYFQNPFTLAHWFGTVLVFGGTLMFSDIHNLVFRSKDSKKQD